MGLAFPLNKTILLRLMRICHMYAIYLLGVQARSRSPTMGQHGVGPVFPHHERERKKEEREERNGENIFDLLLRSVDTSSHDGVLLLFRLRGVVSHEISRTNGYPENENALML